MKAYPYKLKVYIGQREEYALRFKRPTDGPEFGDGTTLGASHARNGYHEPFGSPQSSESLLRA